MGIRILEGGALTTVQDRGRYGYQSTGFSVSGVMDRRSFQIAGALLGKRETGAALEAALLGPTIEFTEDVLFALTGADMKPKLNGWEIPMYHALLGKRGDVLSLGFAVTGVYGYIAFAGEMDVPVVMGSKSTNLKCRIGGYEGRTLERGDEIGILGAKTKLPNMYKRYEDIHAFTETEKEIRVLAGPEADYFTEEGMRAFLESVYTVTDSSDRMGYRLEGEAVASRRGVDIISNGIAFGAVQIPPSGKPIVMMADRQTMGGYAKIANVATVDLPELAQSRSGTKLHFKMITIEEAQKLLRREKAYMRYLYRATN
ncbi:MAG: biotin-dependent carboxyltransferase family protein [Lachnospiraceae bacterium]|nr:biotin-dependent carboxyltransferase family protein [Lachnospiraceae bacterium]